MDAYTFSDPEREVIDYLNSKLTEPVGAGFPKDTQPKYVQVEWDGTPTVDYPVTERATVRVTAWTNPVPANQPADPTLGKTGAKTLGALAQAYALSFPGSPSVYGIHKLTGRLVDRDPDTGRYFCSFTCRVSTVASAVA